MPVPRSPAGCFSITKDCYEPWETNLYLLLSLGVPALYCSPCKSVPHVRHRASVTCRAPVSVLSQLPQSVTAGC